MSHGDTGILNPLQRRPLVQIIDEEAKRHRRRVLGAWLSAGAVLALAFGAYFMLRPKPVPLSARYRTQAVSRGAVIREVHATGHAEALTTVLVGAEISGRIATVEADFNHRVSEGQVLARFDRSALQAQLAQGSAALSAARTTLEQATTEAIQALRVRDRVARLHAQQSVPDSERDSAEANAELAEQRVEVARAQVAAQAAALALARTNLAHAEIRSPIDGVVITRNVDPGQSVASVLAAPTLFTVAANLRLMRVVGAVDEADIGEVREGQAATFTVSAYPDRVFEGTVVEVRNSPVVVQDVVTYGTVIDAENLDLALKPGMTASVRIRTAEARDVLRVPNGALHFTPPGERPDGAASVWIVQHEQVRRIPLRPGISDGELTAVDAPTLPRDARVIVELSAAGRAAHGLGS
jgi:HlyD family secretion protein